MAAVVRLDQHGIGVVAKSPGTASVVKELAERVAANVQSQGLATDEGEPMPVEVESYTTDRAAASVSLAHPAGLAMQARYGALTRAAAAAGLEVSEQT